MPRQSSVKNSSSSSPHTAIERRGFVTEVPATTTKTTTTMTAARKQVTTSMGKNSGNQVLSRSTTYKYLKINESLVKENIPKLKVSAPRRDVVSSHQQQDYNISSGSERNLYIKNTNESYSYLRQLNAQPSRTKLHNES